MAMVCPQCNQLFEADQRICPRCNIHLLVHHRSSPSTVEDEFPNPGATPRWQRNFAARLIVSVILSQGLAYCLQQASSAWEMVGGDAGGSWMTPFGVFTLHSFHAIALILTGMLVGANMENGGSCGAVLGLINGVLFVLFHREAKEIMPIWLFFGQPLIHLVFGAIGGTLGSRIWKPCSLFSLDEGEDESASRARPRLRLLKGPIHTIRVCVGAFVVLIGLMFTKQLFDFIMSNANGRVETFFQENLIRYQVMGLAILLGSMFAGATTFNGFKQGLCVGILASSLYIGTQFANPKAILDKSVGTAIVTIAVSLLGGVFGAALFPPLVKTQKKLIPY
jgi:hypothetical protein